MNYKMLTCGIAALGLLACSDNSSSPEEVSPQYTPAAGLNEALKPNDETPKVPDMDSVTREENSQSREEILDSYRDAGHFLDERIEVEPCSTADDKDDHCMLKKDYAKGSVYFNYLGSEEYIRCEQYEGRALEYRVSIKDSVVTQTLTVSEAKGLVDTIPFYASSSETRLSLSCEGQYSHNVDEGSYSCTTVIEPNVFKEQYVLIRNTYEKEDGPDFSSLTCVVEGVDKASGAAYCIELDHNGYIEEDDSGVDYEYVYKVYSDAKSAEELDFDAIEEEFKKLHDGSNVTCANGVCLQETTYYSYANESWGQFSNDVVVDCLQMPSTPQEQPTSDN